MNNPTADHGRSTVHAGDGIVATGHRLATAAALDVLREGGHAADAAVAAAAVSMVVLPHRSAIGGDVFALTYDRRTRRVHAYNGSGRAPMAIRPSLFEATYPSTGAILATIPGALRAWGDLHRDQGRLDFGRLLAPAVRIAEEGFAVSDLMARMVTFSADRLKADPDCERAFLRGGHPLRAGEVFRQPALAQTLRRLAADGPDSFYRGELAETLAAEVRAKGGLISEDDLAAHATDRPEPISVRYRDLTVFGQPPVSQGHILLEELAIAEGHDMSAHRYGDADLVHFMVEAKKIAFEDRDRFAGDPHVVDFRASRLLESTFVEQRRRMIGPRAAGGETAMPSGATDTTYIAVVDRDRNAVSLIESVYDAFGAATLLPKTGIILNNRLIGFSLDPRSPNHIAPGKRPVHTLNSVIALEGEELRYVFGTPGRDAQVQTNFQVAVALVDFGLDVQEAIDAPRWLHRSGQLQLEGRFPPEVQQSLRARGHRVALLADWATVTGGAQVVKVSADGGLQGGADPRREGLAAGY